jgi:hypothetical protein
MWGKILKQVAALAAQYAFPRVKAWALAKIKKRIARLDEESQDLYLAKKRISEIRTLLDKRRG